jgi:hypothetical protein
MVFASKKIGVKTKYHERRLKMRKKMNLILLCALLIATAGITSCRSYAGFGFYSQSPRFARTHQNQVILIQTRPRRSYIELGEVWIRPNPRMSRRSVEKKLRRKAARMGADAVVIIEDRYTRNRVTSRRYKQGTMIYRERRIGGIAIRFR